MFHVILGVNVGHPAPHSSKEEQVGVTNASGGDTGPVVPKWVLVLVIAALAFLAATAAKNNRNIPIGDQPSPAPSHSAVSFFRELPGKVAHLIA